MTTEPAEFAYLAQYTSPVGVRFYGRSRRNDDDQDCGFEGLLHCYVGDASKESLQHFFDAVLQATTDDSNNFQETFLLYFHDFDFNEIATNITNVLGNVTHCHFINCRNMTSLGTAVQQFRKLQELECIDCQSIVSLSSLSVIPERAPFTRLAFTRCGLRVTASDHWEEGFRAIASTRGDYGFCLDIRECNFLCCLPNSIRHLKEKSGKFSLHLYDNDKFWALPNKLSEIQNLRRIKMYRCSQVTCLPWTLSLVDGKCEIVVDNSMGKILSRLRAPNMDACTSGDYRTRIKDLKDLGYFKMATGRLGLGFFKLCVHIKRSKYRAIARIYKPPIDGAEGGQGYYRSMENYETTKREHFGASLDTEMDE